MQQMLEQENFLNEEELEIYKRGRNSKSHTVAKMPMSEHIVLRLGLKH